MNIASKLSIIVALTIIEVSITVGAAFEISKGATFHQLNVLHLKYNALFSKSLVEIENGKPISPRELSATIGNIRQQPVDCLALVNFLDVFIMKRIGTHYALDVCRLDVEVADRALASVDQYRDGDIDKPALFSILRVAEEAFHTNSAEFEAPIAKTVSFILRTLIPAIIIISVFNIAFITYLSRTISSSIRNAIGLLQNGDATNQPGEDVETQISGELAELLTVARKRIRSDIFNQELSAELEKEVEQRTAKLQRANEDLAEFAYRASHDLKAPLSSSKSLVQFISQDIESGNLNEASLNAKKVCEQMERLEKLVVDIFSLTRADLGAGETEQIDFHELVREIKGRLYSIDDYADLLVTEDIRIQTPLVSEKARIAQIIENLLSNAMKYRATEKEDSFVKIRVIEEQRMYSLTVEDNGVGIPEGRRSEVFEMFKRFHPDIGEGTGLGLAIVKKHVDFLKGSINFDSSTDGTVFAVHIPK